MWHTEDFDLYSAPDPGQKQSVLEQLRRSAAFLDRHLCSAADQLDEHDAPHVVAFFQVPGFFATDVSDFMVPGASNGIKIRMTIEPIRVYLDDWSNIRVSSVDINDNTTNGLQVVAFVPLWGRRAAYHQRYRQCFTPTGIRDAVIIPQEESWRFDSALRVRDFEHGICKRIIPELIFGVRRILKSYSIISKQNLSEKTFLFNYFIMPASGRVTYNRIPVPLASYYMNNPPVGSMRRVAPSEIESAIPFTLRTFSRFEGQIFVISKLISLGHYAIALVSSVALIEWLLRICAPDTVSNKNLFSLLEAVDSQSLALEARTTIHNLRRIRNSIVHGSSSPNNVRPHEVTTFAVDELVRRETAELGRDLAWKIFQLANAGKLFRSPSEIANEFIHS